MRSPAKSFAKRAVALSVKGKTMSTTVNKTGALLVVAGMLVASLPASAQTPNVQILTYGVHYGGQVIYRYQVRNNTASPIDAVTLGIPSPGKELPDLPWSQNKGLTDVPTEVPLSQCRPFNNMVCLVGVFQFDYMDAPKSIIRMYGRELAQTPPPARFSKSEHIAPNSTSSIAEIYVPSRAADYLSASGTVRFFSNHPKDSTGKPIVDAEIPFTRADRTPPAISGTATAVKRGAMLDVTVSLRVTDNLDPNPEVALVSVTSNEPLHRRDVEALINTDARTLSVKRNKGRIYYLTYRAMDGSENSSTVLISVPGELP